MKPPERTTSQEIRDDRDCECYIDWSAMQLSKYFEGIRKGSIRQAVRSAKRCRTKTQSHTCART